MSEIPIAAYALGAPLYREVERKLTQSIHQGEWKPGEALPAEKRLAERYGISMGTLRKAVDEMVAKGMLIRQQGRGTFVAKHGRDRYLFAFFHVLHQDGRKEYPTLNLLEFGRAKAGPEAVRLLGVPAGARMTRLVNSLSLHGATVIVDEIFLPESIFPSIARADVAERPGTLYQLYQEQFNVTVIRTEERLRAVKADVFKAGLLGVEVGDPLLLVIRVARALDDQAIELRYSWINTTDYEYYAELIGNS